MSTTGAGSPISELNNEVDEEGGGIEIPLCGCVDTESLSPSSKSHRWGSNMLGGLKQLNVFGGSSQNNLDNNQKADETVASTIDGAEKDTAPPAEGDDDVPLSPKTTDIVSEETTTKDDDVDETPTKRKSLKKGWSKKLKNAAGDDNKILSPKKKPKKRSSKKEGTSSPKRSPKKSPKKKKGSKSARKEESENNDTESNEAVLADMMSPEQQTKTGQASPTNECTSKDHDGEGTDDNGEDEDEMAKMLDSIAIPNFSMSDDDDDNDDASAEMTDKKKVEKQVVVPSYEAVDWETRLRRSEVFSTRYKPSKEEKKELQDIAAHLSVGSSASVSGMGMRMTMGSSNTVNLQALFFGNHAVLLKKGPVLWKENKCELIVMTDGWVLSYRERSKFSLLQKRIETCHLWSEMEFCEQLNDMSFCIVMKSGQTYEIEATEEQGDRAPQWMTELESVVVRHAEIGKALPTDTLGWQHRLVRKPGFSAAVMGDVDLLGKARISLNVLDRFNQFSPLHYALLVSDEVNAELVKQLLQNGADPNFPDGDDRNAMYYAERNGLTEVKAILQGSGGQQSKLAETEMRGELFGGVDFAQEKTNKRREVERVAKENEQAEKDKKAAEAQEKAQSAQSEMNKAMSALVERGEKIQEIGDKAQDLNDQAQTYATLASQLKDQAKKKKWYHR